MRPRWRMKIGIIEGGPNRIRAVANRPPLAPAGCSGHPSGHWPGGHWPGGYWRAPATVACLGACRMVLFRSVSRLTQGLANRRQAQAGERAGLVDAHPIHRGETEAVAGPPWRGPRPRGDRSPCERGRPSRGAIVPVSGWRDRERHLNRGARVVPHVRRPHPRDRTMVWVGYTPFPIARVAPERDWLLACGIRPRDSTCLTRRRRVEGFLRGACGSWGTRHATSCLDGVPSCESMGS
jgi:hypothetical protein